MSIRLPMFVLAVAAAWPLLAPAQAPDAERREALREKWQSMTPEQRAAAREKLRERREAMTPQQQADARERRQERVERMTPEQREQLRQRLAERRGAASAPAR